MHERIIMNILNSVTSMGHHCWTVQDIVKRLSHFLAALSTYIHENFEANWQRKWTVILKIVDTTLFLDTAKYFN